MFKRSDRIRVFKSGFKKELSGKFYEFMKDECEVCLEVTTEDGLIAIQGSNIDNKPDLVPKIIYTNGIVPDVYFNYVQLRFEFYWKSTKYIFLITNESGNGSIVDIAKQMGIID